MTLWNIDGNDIDVTYRNIQSGTSETEAYIRASLDGMWQVYEPYADPDFRDGFARDPEARFWEMYIAVQLLEAGKMLVPSQKRDRSRGGPDILIQEGNERVWIEAIAPTTGTGLDKVPETIPISEGGGSQNAPTREGQLRFTGALRKKRKILEKYIQLGIVKESDINIIAVGFGRMGAKFNRLNPPIPISSLFPFGQKNLVIDKKSMEAVAIEYVFSDEIDRESAAVSRDGFLTNDNAVVSGIMWSTAGIGNFHRPVRPMVYLHNPNAHTNLPQKWADWDHEFIMTSKDNEITIEDIAKF